jgi:hypothetical protein
MWSRKDRGKETETKYIKGKRMESKKGIWRVDSKLGKVEADLPGGIHPFQ